MTNLLIAKLQEMKNNDYVSIMEKVSEINSIASNFKSTTLKIHSAAFYLGKKVEDGTITQDQEESIFKEICQHEYECFKEWEKENLSYVSRDYIGRSSSFYYMHLFNGEYIKDGNYQDVLKGKPLEDVTGDILAIVHDYCNHKNTEEDVLNSLIEEYKESYIIEDDNDQEEMENFIYEQLEDQQVMLEDILEELSDLLEVVQEAHKAYEYLAEYKTVENEEYIAQHAIDAFLDVE